MVNEELYFAVSSSEVNDYLRPWYSMVASPSEPLLIYDVKKITPWEQLQNRADPRFLEILGIGGFSGKPVLSCRGSTLYGLWENFL